MPRAQWTTVLAPVRGLDSRIPAIMQDRQYAPVLENLRLDNGTLTKRPGLTTFGNVRFLEPITRFDQYYKFDGSSYLLAFAQSCVYRYNTTTTGWIPINIGTQVEDCEDSWDEQVIGNVTPSTITDNVNGTNAVRLTVASGFTTGIIATEAISSADLSSYDTISLMLRSSVATSAGDIKLLLDDTANCASPIETLSVPALAADEWTAVCLTLASPGSLTAVISVGLQLDTDLGAMTLDVDDLWAVTAFSGTTAAADRWSSDFFSDSFYFTNGVDNVMQYTGSGQATAPSDISTTIDTAKVVRSHGSRLNAFHTTESATAIPQRHRYAAAGGIDFAASGSGSGDYFEGSDWIIDAVPLGNRMIVYKQRSINSQEHVGGAFVFRRERIVTGVNLMAKDSVIDLGDSHIVLADDNIYIYTGARNPSTISDPIRDELYDIINDTQAGLAFAIQIEAEDEVWFCVPTGNATFPDVAYVYNYRTQAWSKMTFNIELTTMGHYTRQTTITWDDLSGTWDEQTWRWDDRELLSLAPSILVADSSGYVYTLDPLSNADGTAEIECVFETVDTPYTDDHTRRMERFLELAFEAKGTSVDVSYSLDEGSTWTSIETVSLTSSWTRYRVEFDAYSRKIRFRFRQSSTTGTLALRHYEVKHIPRSTV